MKRFTDVPCPKGGNKNKDRSQTVMKATCTGARIFVQTVTSGGTKSRNGYNEAKHRIPMDGGKLVRIMSSGTDMRNMTFNNLCNFY
jgi:hypothetical protein